MEAVLWSQGGRIPPRGVDLFQEVCRLALRMHCDEAPGRHLQRGGADVGKIKNRAYSQAMGRRERFDRMRGRIHHQPPVRRLPLRAPPRETTRLAQWAIYGNVRRAAVLLPV